MDDAIVTYGSLPLSLVEQPKLGPGLLLLPVAANEMTLFIVVRGGEGTKFALGGYDSAAAYSLKRIALGGATSLPFTPTLVVLDISAIDPSGEEYSVSISNDGILFVQAGVLP